MSLQMQDKNRGTEATNKAATNVAGAELCQDALHINSQQPTVGPGTAGWDPTRVATCPVPRAEGSPAAGLLAGLGSAWGAAGRAQAPGCGMT